MSRRQKKKQERKRLAKMGIPTKRELERMRLKEAKAAARERRKGMPTRKERERMAAESQNIASQLADLFDFEEVEEKEDKFDYDYFRSKAGATQDAGDGYNYIYHLFMLDVGSPGFWEHEFTKTEIMNGTGYGFNWARAYI